MEKIFSFIFFRPKIRICLVLLIALFYLHSVSQQPVIEQFMPADGLPSSSIFDIIQDDMGYIWLATDNGLSRYNGVEFENFSIYDGLTDPSIIHFSRGRNDTIWCLGFGGSISVISGGKITSDTILNEVLAHNFNTYIDKIHYDTLKQYWLATRAGGLYKIDKNYVLTKVYDETLSGMSQYVFFRDFGDGGIVTVIDPPDFLKEELPEFYRDGDSYFFLRKTSVIHLHRNWLKKSPGNYLISYRKTVYKIKDYKFDSQMKFDQRVIDMQRDHQGNLWISHFEAGVDKYNGCDMMKDPELLFANTTISRTFQDDEQILWFGTTNDGLFRISSSNFLVYPNEGGNTRYSVKSLTASEDRLFFSTYNNRVFYIPKEGEIKKTIKFNMPPMENYIHDIHVDNNNILWVLNSPYLTYRMDGTPVPGNEEKRGLEMIQLHDGSYVTNAHVTLRIWDDNNLIETSTNDLQSRILDIYQDSHGNLWVGTLHGLYLYENQEFSLLDKHPELVDERVTSLNCLNENLVVGYGMGHLALLANDSIYRVIPKMHPNFGKINAIVSDRDSILWLGTEEGLKKISIKSFSPFIYDIVTYRTGDGLSADRINDLLIYDDILWLGSSRGLMSFANRDERKPSIPPRVAIKSFQVNNAVVDMNSKLEFEHDQNNIRIDFHGISQKGPQNINYRYRLVPHDPGRVTTENEFANFPDLQPGAYTFFVNAGNVDGTWNERPTRISFTIRKPFTKTILFYVLVIGSILVFLTAIFLGILNFIKRRNALKQNLVLMQQRLLRSQMNPHFVFNSLLAIQSYIFKNDAKEAGRYLSRFARLIRMILNSSRKELISLEEELEYLNYYLDLQKLRFKSAFDYEIIIEEGLYPERVMLPPMLAQPFIENAIEHGLRNLDHKGMLTITFRCKDPSLIFEVRDNGIGISKAEKLKMNVEADYESLGQKITTDRLQLLNKTHGHKVTFNIEEIVDKNGEIKGTSVSFNIQYKDGNYCR